MADAQPVQMGNDRGGIPEPEVLIELYPVSCDGNAHRLIHSQRQLTCKCLEVFDPFPSFFVDSGARSHLWIDVLQQIVGDVLNSPKRHRERQFLGELDRFPQRA